MKLTKHPPQNLRSNSFLSVPVEPRSNLQSLSKTHVISKDAAQAIAYIVHQPMIALQKHGHPMGLTSMCFWGGLPKMLPKCSVTPLYWFQVAGNTQQHGIDMKDTIILKVGKWPPREYLPPPSKQTPGLPPLKNKHHPFPILPLQLPPTKRLRAGKAARHPSTALEVAPHVRPTLNNPGPLIRTALSVEHGRFFLIAYVRLPEATKVIFFDRFSWAAY